jgi:hypothetical protein
MITLLGIKMDKADYHKKHHFHCWRCKDTGVVPYNNEKGIDWTPAKTNDAVYWVKCNFCDYHKKSAENV